MTEEATNDEENNRYRYKIRILIRHPNMDPARITEALGVTPKISGMVGGERRAPNDKLLPGVHKDSFWSDSFVVEGNRRFFSGFARLLDKLEPHRALLTEIADSGGEIMLIIHLPGDENMGDSLSLREMERLCRLRISLGLEVFPEYN